jgi:S-formylglutathione hydrolase
MAVKRWEASIKKAWAEGRLPKLLLVTPAVDISLYQDAHGRGLKWEQAFVGPLLDHLRKGFRIWQDRPAFYATGISAGGAITLRLGLKYPELFGGIAALVPGNEAAATLKDLKFEDTFWRPQNNYEGVDPEAWAKNHPLNIAAANAERIRSSKMGIYLETGDEDSFMLDRGTEKMHRVLWDNNIPHEYHLRRGVDHHVGTIMPTRWQDAYAFLGAHMRNLPPEQIVLDLKKAVNALKEQAAKGIPNDPKVNELYMTLFGFARQQMELEAKLLNNP